MLLTPTPDQEFLRETTEKFLAEFTPPGSLRELHRDPAGFDPDVWRRGAELGWTSLLVSEANGGGTISGRAEVDLTLIAEAFGAAAAPGPFAPANLVAAALDAAGGAHPDVLAGLIAGTTVAAWAYEEGHAVDPDSLTCTARVEGGDLVLDGVKRPVEAALQASHLLVTARTDDGITQVLVPADTAGVTMRAMGSIDLTRRFAEVTFTGVRVPVGAAVGEIGGARASVDRQLLLALLMANAESVGAMQRAFDITVEWAFDRFTFGRPIASYQALKHRYADMACWLQCSHAISDDAAAALADADPRATELAAAAKIYIGEHGPELVQDCIQLHGGIGLTFEHDIHLFLRRVVVNRGLVGTPSDHEHRLADLMIRAAESDQEGQAA